MNSLFFIINCFENVLVFLFQTTRTELTGKLDANYKEIESSAYHLFGVVVIVQFIEFTLQNSDRNWIDWSLGEIPRSLNDWRVFMIWCFERFSARFL